MAMVVAGGVATLAAVTTPVTPPAHAAAPHAAAPVAAAAVASTPVAGTPVAGTPVAVAPATSAAATPLLSVRRDPTWIETNLAATRLATSLNGLLNGPGSCLEVQRGGRLLFSVNPDTPLLPASNMKLLTATAVLDRLDPQSRLVTKVEASTAPVNGVIAGDVYLVGGGDALLMTAAYEAGLKPGLAQWTSADQLAAQVKQAGIRRVEGSVVGDDSRYDSERTVPSWEPYYVTEGDVAPLSALELDDGTAPPPPPGSKPTSPTTVPATAAHKTTDSTTSTNPNQPAVPPPDPTLSAAQIFTDLLRRDGIEVDGQPARGVTPAVARPVTQIASPTVAAEVDEMLEVSDDTTAELLTKELGLRVSGHGTTAAGVAAIRADLQSDGLPVSALVNADGSGLSRADRVTCGLLSAVLDRAGPGGIIAAGLPVAGRTGTLEDRLVNTVAAGRVRAKTGTLDDVSSLSGFVDPPPQAPLTDPSEPLVFTALIDGPYYTVSQTTLDRLALTLAAYPQVPPLSAVGPAGP